MAGHLGHTREKLKRREESGLDPPRHSRIGNAAEAVDLLEEGTDRADRHLRRPPKMAVQTVAYGSSETSISHAAHGLRAFRDFPHLRRLLAEYVAGGVRLTQPGW